MESGSRADNPPGRTSNRLADVVGTLIALLTLIMPMMAIAYYSSTSPPGFIPPPVNMRK
ncbi:MAG TPA: hypothetical protein V6C78_04610 [Crinalium sp.]